MSAEMQEQSGNRKKSNTLLLIYINIALYATCFQIQRPLEPFLVEKLGLTGDSGGEYAKLQSFFSLMQTVGSLLAGSCLDRFGAKGGFIISFLASALSYFLLSKATTLNLLYVSKIPTIFQAGYLCAQLAASQATSDGAERVLALGRLSMSYTIGAILGPALGGFLGASGDYYLGAKIATGGSLLSVLITLFMPTNPINHNLNHKDSIGGDDDINIGDNNHIDSGDELSPTFLGSKNEKNNDYNSNQGFENLQVKSKKTFTLNNILKSMRNQATAIMGVVNIVWLLLSVKIISSVGNSMLSETFPLVLKNVFHLSEQSLGLAIASNSAFNGIVNGLFLAPLVAYSGGNLIRVITLCLALMTILASTLSVVSLPSFSPFLQILSLSSTESAPVISSSSSNGLFLYLGLTFTLSIFQYALSTTITGESTSLVKKTQKGTLLGVEHSFFALARIVAPQVGVMLLKSGGVSAVSAVSGSVYLAVSVVWGVYKKSLKSAKNYLSTSVDQTSFIKNKDEDEIIYIETKSTHYHPSSSFVGEEYIAERKGK